MSDVLPFASTELAKFWVMPELLLIPAPLTVSASRGFGVIEKALAPELKTTEPTSVLAESVRLWVLEVPKVAVSPDPLGMLLGVQLRAVFQALLVGLGFHVALPATADAAITPDTDTSKRRT